MAYAHLAYKIVNAQKNVLIKLLISGDRDALSLNFGKCFECFS
jgi:hypothetical protein